MAADPADPAVPPDPANPPDPAALAAIAPVGMLFVRCAGGVSHHPAEAVDAADVAVAIEVLEGAVIELAGARSAVSPLEGESP